MKIHNQEKEHIANCVMSAIKHIENQPDPLAENMVRVNEIYLIDAPYDVQIFVRLIKKKSQHEIGMEMFENESQTKKAKA